MANYLVAKCNTVTKSYELKTAEPSKPYLHVSNSYLPLSSGNTTTGLQVKVNGNNCGIQESYTTTVSSSTYTYSRITYYDCTHASFKYTKTASANFPKLCTTYGWNYDSYNCKNSITVSISTTCYCNTGNAKINTTLSYSASVSGDQIYLAHGYADDYFLSIHIKFRNYLNARSMVSNTSFFFKRPLDIDNSGNINRYIDNHEINKSVTMICTDGQRLYLVPGGYFSPSHRYTSFTNGSYIGSYTTKNTYYICPGNEYYSSSYSANDLFFKKVESMMYEISARNLDSGSYYQTIFPLIANISMNRCIMSTGRYTYTQVESYRQNINYVMTTCYYSTYTSSTFNYNCEITTTARAYSYTSRQWDGQTVTYYRTSNTTIYLYRIQESQSWYTKTYSLTTTSQ